MRQLGLGLLASLLLGACLDLAQADSSPDGGGGGGGKDASVGGAGGWPVGGNAGSAGSSGSAASAGTGGGQGGTASLTGKPCTQDSTCAPGFCVALAALVGLGPGNVCTKTCCSSEECSADAVCFPTKGGFSACTLAPAAGRPTPGTSPVGASCSADTECRSALCLDGQCLDACCSDSDCSAADKCTLGELPGTNRSAFMCAKPPGSQTAFGSCAASADCTSGICTGTGTKYCTRRCCTSEQCQGPGSTCGYATLGISSANPIVQICSQTQTGGAPLGSPCSAGSDCAGAYCLSDTKTCSASCCSDADCGDSKFRCRPKQFPSGTSSLFCVAL